MGGLSRRYTAIRKIRENEHIDHLLIDSGNFLFSSPDLHTEKNSSSLTAEIVAEIYREMNFDAVNIGLNDLSAGIDYLRKIDFLPLISANFYDNSGSSIFKPYIIKNDGQLKYAIVGLSSEPLKISSEYSYRSWQQILTPLMQELKPQVDCIILLSSLSEMDNTEIAHRFADIRLIFSAIPKSGNTPPKIINNTLITQTANRGRYLGQLYLVNPGLFDWDNKAIPNVAKVKKQKKAIEYRVSRIEYLIQQNDNKQNTIGTLEKQRMSLLEQLKALEQKDSNEPNPSKSTFRAAFTPLTQNIVEDRRINKMIKDLKNR